MAAAPKTQMTVHLRSKTDATGRTCIDLFAGAGGLAEGFRQAGWSVLAGSDIDLDATATFRLNFPEATFYEGAIADLDPKQLLADCSLAPGDLDCLIGGPPCQSFSYNNHQRSASDTRAKLFLQYLRVVGTLQPKTLVMENVPGMLTIDDGRVVEEIQSALGGLGYSCAIRILYAEDYGVPQTRRRAFVIATREGEAGSIFPDGSHGPSKKPKQQVNSFVHHWRLPEKCPPRSFVTVWEAIGDLPIIPSGGGTEEAEYGDPRRVLHESAFRSALREGSSKLFNHVCHRLTEPMLDRISHVPEGGNWRDIPRDLLTAGMKRARESDHTKRYGRLKRSGLASTLLTKCDPHWGAYIHPTQERTISVREAARLQGFPDRFRFAGSSISRHYVQIGNAVPVPVAKAIGASTRRHLDSSESNAPPDSSSAAA